MSDETGIITKDPNKAKFWTLRNISGLVILAAISAGSPQIVESIQNYHDLHSRAATLEKWRAEMDQNVNDQAYWEAFADVNTKISRLNEKVEVLNRLFNREFGRGAGDLAMELEDELESLKRDRADIAKLHRELERLVSHYAEEHPEFEKPELPKINGQDPATIQDVQRMLQQAQQQAPEFEPFDPGTLKTHYDKRNPKK